MAQHLSCHWGCLARDWSLQNIVQLAVEATQGVLMGGGTPVRRVGLGSAPSPEEVEERRSSWAGRASPLP